MLPDEALRPALHGASSQSPAKMGPYIRACHEHLRGERGELAAQSW